MVYLEIGQREEGCVALGVCTSVSIYLGSRTLVSRCSKRKRQLIVELEMVSGMDSTSSTVSSLTYRPSSALSATIFEDQVSAMPAEWHF